jgi:hypothetical protein
VLSLLRKCGRLWVGDWGSAWMEGGCSVAQVQEEYADTECGFHLIEGLSLR